MTAALVTGGAGFLGSHVAEHLLARGLRVVVVDDLSGGFADHVPAGCVWRRGSVGDARFIDDLFRRHRFRYVYHLAAYAAEGLSHFIRRHNYRVNLLGSVNVLSAAVNHGAEWFVFTSSAAVYGPGGGPFAEGDEPRPADPYGVAKLAAEYDLRAATGLFGLRHVIFRPHNVYGERQNLDDPYRNVVGIFMRQVLGGRPCTVFGDGTQTRGFSYVGDVAPVIAASPFHPRARDETFNIGAGETCSVNELAEAVQAALGCRVGVEHLPPRPEAKHLACLHAKAGRVFGRAAGVGLGDGLRRMADWARAVRFRPRRTAPRVEIARGLPPSWAAPVERVES